MPDTTPQQQPGGPPKVVIAADIPQGSLTKNYGGIIGFGGMAFALLEIFREDPRSSIGLFAQFGPKYILWGFIAYILWDVSKRAIKVLNKASDNIGIMALNTGNLASAVNVIGAKSDRATEEMRRLSSFAASQSNRAVEIVQDVKTTAEHTNEMVQQLLMQSSKPRGEGTAS